MKRTNLFFWTDYFQLIFIKQNDHTYIILMELTAYLSFAVAILFALLAILSIASIVYLNNNAAPFFLQASLSFVSITALLKSIASLDPMGNVTNLLSISIAVPVCLVSLCTYSISVAGVTVVFVDQMTLIRAITPMLAYRVRLNIIRISTVVAVVVLVVGGTSHGVDMYSMHSEVYSYYLSRYVCPGIMYIHIFVASIVLMLSSRSILSKIKKPLANNKNQNNKEDDGKKAAVYVPGFSSIDNSVRYSGFQHRLMYLTRRMSCYLFWISIIGITSLFYYDGDVNNNVNTDGNNLLWFVFQTLMNVGLLVSMFDIVIATVVSCCGDVLWGGNNLLILKHKTADAYGKKLTGAIYEDGSSSEDDEEATNTFVFPVAIQMVSGGGPLGQAKRLSIKS